MNPSHVAPPRSRLASHPDASLLDSLRVVARRHSRLKDESDDLLQDALLEAVCAGRSDLTQAANYRWVVGTLRKLGAMSARGAVRRRLRESRWMAERVDGGSELPIHPAGLFREWRSHPALETLPLSLRQVAMLALAGHDRREIAWLLDLTDTALRQRISTLRRRLSALEPPHASAAHPDEDGGLPFGLIRRALLPVVVASGSAGTHDPDGHLVILGHGGAPRAGGRGAHISKDGGNIST